MVFGSLRRISPEKRRCDLQYLCPRCRQTADSNGDSRLAQDQRKLNALGGQVLVGVLESGRKRKNGTPNREMQTQFQKALIPADIRSLATFDHKVFHRADWFDREDWRTYESWWMIIDNKERSVAVHLKSTSIFRTMSVMMAKIQGSADRSTLSRRVFCHDSEARALEPC